ncbi:MAG: LytTR family transcriptional regulator [Alphaproteobacteria bacterium]|nr:LytTR family transcriptional regulator [Alphaproteobacteria bacterium]
MVSENRAVDWRMPAIWAVLLTLSVFAHAYSEMSDRAPRLGFGRAVIQETASHLVVAALLPALYWLHRKFPLAGSWRNLLVHGLAVVPFSLIHTVGLVGLRLLWFVGVMGERYELPLTGERLAYEFSKDLVNYALLSAAVLALGLLLKRPPAAQPVAPAPASPTANRPQRFAVRKRGGTEVVVEVADIDWVEAAGNYAVLHVGGERLEIRSSLSRLEVELDPERFVRVHKSHMVNIARVAEVVPWVSGDWRIRLQDGAELSLSRRYRARFEALVPVKS